MRPVVLANGRLWVGFDAQGQLRDLCWPAVGQPNHAAGWPSRFGVAGGGRFAWLADPAWSLARTLSPGALVAVTTARRDDWPLGLVLTDTVLPDLDVLLRRVDVRNLGDQPLAVDLFFHLDLSLDESPLGDTVLYHPALDALVHYKRRVYALLSGRGTPGPGLSQWTCGVKRFHRFEGTWRDAEDGRLESNPVAHGSVDSTAAVSVAVGPGEAAQGTFWLVLGDSLDAVAGVHRIVAGRAADDLIAAAERTWRRRLGSGRAGPGEPALAEHSRVLLRAFVDHGGGIVAGVDSDTVEFNRDHYGYVWPRDAALVATALVDAGAGSEAAPYFRFVARGVSAEGYLAHKYNPDGSPGSTWHPAYLEGRAVAPIQADETALTLVALDHYVRRTGDRALAAELLPRLVIPCANFLVRFRTADGLVAPCWDLWEERYGIHAWTAGATYAALLAAARLAEGRADHDCRRWCRAAKEIAEAARRAFRDAASGRLVRTLVPDGGGYRPDPTPDASLWGLVTFGVVPVSAPEAEETRRTLLRTLAVPGVGGIARYVGDLYCRDPDLPADVPGNPWVVTTCWLAEWSARAGEPARARELLAWVERTAVDPGVLPEQVDARTGRPLSVTPLAWSHAAYLTARRTVLGAGRGTDAASDRRAAPGLTATTCSGSPPPGRSS
jgi:GH15 family glucan-1,4-alpha-glucosidase